MIDDNAAAGVRAFVRRTQFKALIYGVVAGLFLVFAVSKPAGFGIIGGTVLSVVNFQMMWADVMGMGSKTSRKIRWFIAGRYIIRYGIIFGFLAVIVLRMNWSVITSFIGFFAVQIVLAAEHVIMPAVFFRK